MTCSHCGCAVARQDEVLVTIARRTWDSPPVYEVRCPDCAPDEPETSDEPDPDRYRDAGPDDGLDGSAW